MGGAAGFELRQHGVFFVCVVAVPRADFSKRTPAAEAVAVALIDHAGEHTGRRCFGLRLGRHSHAVFARIARAARDSVVRPSTPQI